MKEVWRVIPKFSDYEISNLGNIRSRERVKQYKSGRTMRLKSKVKSLRKHPKNDFMMTDLIDDKGKRRTVYPHKCVALAFIENDRPRLKKVVMHKNEDLSDNNVDNLTWASYSESIKRGFLLGKRDNSDLWEKRRKKYGEKGSKKPMGRKDPLTEEEKKKMFLLRKNENMKLATLANKFNCSVSHVHKILKRLESNSEGY